MYKEDLELNNLKWLIYHTTKLNQSEFKPILFPLKVNLVTEGLDKFIPAHIWAVVFIHRLWLKKIDKKELKCF